MSAIEQQVDIAVETRKCREDFAYFAENYCYIQNRFVNTQLLKLYDRQRQVLDKLNELKRQGKPQRIIVRKIRKTQVGMSTLAAALILWRTMLFENSNALVVGYDVPYAELVQYLVLGYMVDNLPDWFKPKLKRRRASEGFVFDNGSRIFITAATRRTPVAIGIRLASAYVAEFPLYPRDVARRIIEQDMRYARYSHQIVSRSWIAVVTRQTVVMRTNCGSTA